VAAALASAVALSEREDHRAEAAARMARLVRELADAAGAVDGVEAVRIGAPALPHVLTLVCDGVDGEAVQAELDRRGFAVGSGSACTAGDYGRSHVLAAMGRDTVGNIRLGLHPAVADDVPAAFAAALADALLALR
jgi:cysteine desulfurase